METTLYIFISWVVLSIIILGFAITSFVFSLLQQNRLNEIDPPDEEDKNWVATNWGIIVTVFIGVIMISLFLIPYTRNIMSNNIVMSIMLGILLVYIATLSILYSKAPTLVKTKMNTIIIASITAVYVIAILIVGTVQLLRKK